MEKYISSSRGKQGHGDHSSRLAKERKGGTKSREVSSTIPEKVTELVASEPLRTLKKATWLIRLFI